MPAGFGLTLKIASSLVSNTALDGGISFSSHLRATTPVWLLEICTCSPSHRFGGSSTIDTCGVGSTVCENVALSRHTWFSSEITSVCVSVLF